tara:strand:+ start:429 stop:674 length:246 start_codon:yes stop_codon:yes gene_type:complete
VSFEKGWISTHKFLFVSLSLYAGDPHQNNAEDDDDEDDEDDDDDDDAVLLLSLLRRLGFVQNRDFATGRLRRVRPQGNRLK